MKYDESIIEAIREGSRRLSAIVAKTGVEARKVDTVLQRLRRNGVLRWASKPGWTLVDEKPAPTAQIATVEGFDGLKPPSEPPRMESPPQSILAPGNIFQIPLSDPK